MEKAVLTGDEQGEMVLRVATLHGRVDGVQESDVRIGLTYNIGSYKTNGLSAVDVLEAIEVAFRDFHDAVPPGQAEGEALNALLPPFVERLIADLKVRFGLEGRRFIVYGPHKPSMEALAKRFVRRHHSA